MVRALLYVPDDAAPRLAAASVAGRSLAVRAMVAALRAGASPIAVPSTLRGADAERALRQVSLVLLSFAALRGLAPSLVFVVAVVAAVGSQIYWVGCLARIRRT